MEVNIEKLKEVRKAFGYTQADLGKYIGVTGTSVFRWESGLSNITLKNLGKIIKVFNGVNEFKVDNAVFRVICDKEFTINDFLNG